MCPATPFKSSFGQSSTNSAARGIQISLLCLFWYALSVPAVHNVKGPLVQWKETKLTTETSWAQSPCKVESPVQQSATHSHPVTFSKDLRLQSFVISPHWFKSAAKPRRPGIQDDPLMAVVAAAESYTLEMEIGEQSQPGCFSIWSSWSVRLTVQWSCRSDVRVKARGCLHKLRHCVTHVANSDTFAIYCIFDWFWFWVFFSVIHMLLSFQARCWILGNGLELNYMPNDSRNVYRNKWVNVSTRE